MTDLNYATAKLAEQKQRIRELEKEADWLAHKVAVSEIHHCDIDSCFHVFSEDQEGCVHCWREAARKAVNNG